MSVVLNMRAGGAPERDALVQAIVEAGLDAEIVELRDGLDPAALARAASASGVLVAAGGDGTVSAVAAAAAAAGRPFGVIPCGTLNHFARDMQIPTALDEAIAVLAAGRTRVIDAGDVNGRLFINNASLGAYPRMVWERNRARRRGLPRPLAMALAVARTWMALRTDVVHATVDGAAIVRRTPFIFVGNSAYEVEGTDIGRRPVMTDGTLWLTMAPKFGRADALLLPVRVILRTLERHERFESMTASTIVVQTARPRVSVALDGEVAVFDAPLTFTVRRGALTVVAP
jgi:diacylglycerol kinase family enzyme